MNDFSTIFWTVIIIGAMIVNFASKSRKTRGKDGNAHPQHGEAWPSIPWDNGRDAETANTPGTETVSRKPATRGTVAAGKGETWSGNETGAGQAGQGQQAGQARQQVGQARQQVGQADGPKQPVSADFPDKCQRLEVITSQAHETKRKGPRTATPGMTGAYSEAVRSPERGAGAKKSESTGGQGPISPSGEPGAAEIAEEFDLRRAVIYSEILKPKFEE